jgi:hypothetical protein
MMGLTPAASIILKMVKLLASLIEEFRISLTHLTLGDWVIESRFSGNITRQHAVLSNSTSAGVGTGTGTSIGTDGMMFVIVIVILVVFVARIVVFVLNVVLSGVGFI